ncbi:MAG TPA: ribosome biogenesis factor YjgA [Thiobacillaceae bacterium]|nr:ribosome biogenesis factor YjgA [Thiobacillaceae bacterium]
MAIITATESPAVRLIDPDAESEFDPDEAYRGPSKSQKKREVEALQDLGAQLVKLPEAHFQRIELPEALRDAVAVCRRITQNSALRRQRQYIGKLMRSIDPAPIRAQLDAFSGASAAESARLHQAEKWREKLIADDGALTLFLDKHPGADATRLRQLIRAARDEATRGKPPKAFRELFRMVREVAQAPD